MALRYFSWRNVQTCVRVVLCQRKNGLPSFTARSMKSSAPARNSPSTVSMRFLVSGPVSSMRCLPTTPQRASSVGSLRAVAQECSTPRGPKRSLKDGSFG